MSNTSLSVTMSSIDVFVDTRKEVSVGSDGFSACNIRQAWNSSLTLDSESFHLSEVSLYEESGGTASSAVAVENSPIGRKRGMGALLRRTCKTERHWTRLEHIVPPLRLDTHSYCPELTPVSCSSSLKLRSDGEWTISESSSTTGPYWLEHTPDSRPAILVNTPDIDSDYPEQTESESESQNSLGETSTTPVFLTEDKNTLVEVYDSSDTSIDWNNTDQSWSSTTKTHTETTDAATEDLERVSVETQSGIMASPANTVENSQKEHHTTGMKRKGICAFFRKTWKIVKRPFLCHKTKVEPIVLPLKPGTQPTCVPCSFSLKQGSVEEWTASRGSSVTGPSCLEEVSDTCPPVSVNTSDTDSDYPPQMSESLCSLFISSMTPFSLTEGCEDEETSVEVNDSSMSNNTEQAGSSLLTTDKNTTDASAEELGSVSLVTRSGIMASPSNIKGRKRRGIRKFFQKMWKTVKCLFICSETRVKSLSLQSDLHPPYTESMSIPCASSLEQSSAREWTNSESSSVAGCSWFEQCPGVPVNTLGWTCFEPSDGNVNSHYNVGSLLGKGGFGTVYEGTRISDGHKVAIKFLSKCRDDCYLSIPGHSKPLHTEVALMLMVQQPPISPNVIRMYEWFEDPRNVAVVIEYPQPCVNLRDFIRRRYALCEKDARVLMRQAVLAVQHCIRHGVFHSDIHPANMLVNTRTLELKLIDFGCGQQFSNAALSSFEYVGVPAYCSPEVQTNPTFHAIPANVWSLGLVLYEMVNGCLPYRKIDEVLFVNPNLSNSCRDIIRKCLTRDPARRPTLEQILRHRWFRKRMQDE